MLETDLDRIVDYVDRYSRDHGFPPSYAEIGEACGLASVGHVQYWVNRLIGEGRLARSPGRARSLVVVARKVYESPTQRCEQNRVKAVAASLFRAARGLVCGGSRDRNT